MKISKERSIKSVLSMAFLLATMPVVAKEAPPLDNRIYNCDYLVREHKGITVVMVLGDANVVSQALPAVTGLASVFNVNPINGLCYPAREPLMGTVATTGSPWVRLANQLVENNKYHEVLLVPVILPKSGIDDWKKEGRVSKRLQNMLSALQKQNITIDVVLWQHGQKNDTLISHKEQYESGFADVVEILRSNGTTAPIFVAKTGDCISKATGTVWEAQASIVGSTADVLAGPDLSTLEADHFDATQCALNEKGLDAYVQLWLKTLSNLK